MNYIIVRRTSSSGEWKYGLTYEQVLATIQPHDRVLKVGRNTSRCTMVEYITLINDYSGKEKDLKCLERS